MAQNHIPCSIPSPFTVSKSCSEVPTVPTPSPHKTQSAAQEQAAAPGIKQINPGLPGVLNELCLGEDKWVKCLFQVPLWVSYLFQKKCPHTNLLSHLSLQSSQHVSPTPHVLHELGLVLEAIQRPRDHQIHLDSIAFPVPRARTWQSNSGLQRKTHGFHVCCRCHVSTY